jgi:hypothetical protein
MIIGFKKINENNQSADSLLTINKTSFPVCLPLTILVLAGISSPF